MTESSERAVSVLKPMSGTEETGVGPACCSPHVALRTGHNVSAARMAQHPGAARLSEPELIRKCRMFRDRGVSYLMIARRLSELYGVHRSPDCIRHWCTGRTVDDDQQALDFSDEPEELDEAQS